MLNKRNAVTVISGLLMCIGAMVQAQNIDLKGRIVDAETNKPVEFANIGVVSTYMGTASDFDGYYELSVNESYANYKVQISAVGYKVKEFTVDELHVLKGEAIKLFTQTYGLEEVDVKADSKRLYGILKTAANVIGDSYKGSYGARVYMQQSFKEQTSEAVIYYTDAQGYGIRSLAAAHSSRGFEVQELRRNYSPTPIEGGMLYANDVLAFDIVRQRGNVLDVAFVNDYSLELADETVVGGDSVWVIRYKLNEPDVAKTGDAYCKEYKGLIFIRQNDYAVLRNELEFVSNGFFHAGRDAYRNEVGDALYKGHVVSDYRLTEDGKYALSKVVYSGDGVNGKRTIEWIVYDYEPYQKAAQRSYFSNREADKDFWSRFALPADR
ncbi:MULTISPECIES: carboxypeptidase-like regulatory domain-containing protein [unclassified Carboxylicivirga]|uniref:carboxypeptidase-like regulatory domain-containing protein n=1 Tax=Carboxylicivirga TaxID=1628153 RepID=UPI003D33EFE2